MKSKCALCGMTREEIIAFEDANKRWYPDHDHSFLSVEDKSTSPTDSGQSKEQGECKCEEISCKGDCTFGHTHKTFWCEKCHPERYENTEEVKAEEPQQRGWIKILEVTYDLILKAPHRTLALTLLEDFVKTVESNAKAEGAREAVDKAIEDVRYLLAHEPRDQVQALIAEGPLVSRKAVQELLAQLRKRYDAK